MCIYGVTKKMVLCVAGGLCLNDFILAAKIDKVKTSDLIKKNRFWA